MLTGRLDGKERESFENVTTGGPRIFQPSAIRHLMRSSWKLISLVSHLNLLSFCVLNLFLLGVATYSLFRNF